MKMLRNMDPVGGIRDFWDYIRQDRPHRWAALVFAVVFPSVIIYLFAENVIREGLPERKITYFENWTTGRTDAEIQADWVQRAKDITRRNAERRAAYQRLADEMGIEYDSKEADRITRETLGAEADEIGKRPEREVSNIAERAARGPESVTPAAAPAP